MATMMQGEELKAPDDPLLTREVTLTFKVSRSALMRLQADQNPTRSHMVGLLHLITAGLLTHCEELQARDLAPPVDAAGNPNVPAQHRNDELLLARRWAAEAMTHLETGCMFAVKATTAGN